MPKLSHLRAGIIDGLADGNIASLGIIAAMVMSGQTPLAIWVACLGAGIAEFAGMAAGWYQSTPSDGVWAAIACGLASTIGAICPAIPFLFLANHIALIIALIIGAVICSVIAWMHENSGVKVFLMSYTMTAIAIGLCLLGGLLPA